MSVSKRPGHASDSAVDANILPALSTLSLSAFVYEPLDHMKDAIRLIEILPGPQNDVIRREMPSRFESLLPHGQPRLTFGEAGLPILH
jgi:hypothetical protein